MIHNSKRSTLEMKGSAVARKCFAVVKIMVYGESCVTHFSSILLWQEVGAELMRELTEEINLYYECFRSHIFCLFLIKILILFNHEIYVNRF